MSFEYGNTNEARRGKERIVVGSRDTKLTKWGNSQGVIIPKRMCESLGLRVGDTVTLTANPRTGAIELTPRTKLKDMPSRRLL